LVVPAEGVSPVELIATVNGTAFHVLAESLSRERVFGDAPASAFPGVAVAPRWPRLTRQ
jgi:hypothetical protein